MYASKVAGARTLVFFVKSSAGVTQSRVESLMISTSNVFSVTLGDGSSVVIYNPARDSVTPSISLLGVHVCHCCLVESALRRCDSHRC